MQVLIGVDGGGSKTACVVASPEGAVLGRGIAGPSNYQAVGIEEASARVREAISEALASAGTTESQVEVVGLCLALAGLARPEDRFTWRAVVDTLPGCARRVDDAVLTHDAMAALVGGTGEKRGVVCIAGTGAIAFGVNARGDERRSSGWGYLLGDEGSGYWIGLQGLRAVCRADDGRGVSTLLSFLLLREDPLSYPPDVGQWVQELFMGRAQLTSPQTLVRLVYGTWKPADIASLAPLVLYAADHEDLAAREIVEQAADELALAVGSLVFMNGMAAETFDIVTAGGLWGGSELLRTRFELSMRDMAPHARVITPRNEPVIGAVKLAREAAGI